MGEGEVEIKRNILLGHSARRAGIQWKVYSGTKNKNTQNPHIKVTTRHKNGPKWAKIAVSGILDHIPEF